MNIENALAIQGWMDPHDLEWLAERAAAHSRIVELGCWRGRSTTCLADNTPGVVYAVDHWCGSEEHQPVDAPKLYQMFLDQMAGYIASGKVIPTRASSTAAAAEFAARGLTFDMIFVDASHDYESVKADLAAWWPLVAPGGLFCGHDAGYGPVLQATTETFPNLHHEHSMWVVEK